MRSTQIDVTMFYRHAKTARQRLLGWPIQGSRRSSRHRSTRRSVRTLHRWQSILLRVRTGDDRSGYLVGYLTTNCCIAYSKSSSVIASGHSKTLSSGVQRGRPIGPLLFALAVDMVASGVESEMNVSYLKDATIGGTPESILSDVQRCITE